MEKHEKTAMPEHMEPFDVDRARTLDHNVIDTAWGLAQNDIASLSAALDRFEDRAATMLGWIIAAGMSLAGIFAATLLTADSPNWKIATAAGYGLVLCFVVATILVRGILFKTYRRDNGACPSVELSKDRLDALNSVDAKIQTPCLKLWDLGSLQDDHIFNRRTLDRYVKAYRAAIRTIAYGMAAGVALCIGLAMLP